MTMRASVLVEGRDSGAGQTLNATGQALDQIAAKGKAAAAATGQHAGAAQRQQVAVAAATAATRVDTMALQANAAAARMAALQRQQMVFQLNDVFVSLASGMNPAIVAMQQGSQMLQYGWRPALQSIASIVGALITKLWPLSVVVGVIAGGIGGMTAAINENGAAQVSWGDTALAVFQVVASGLYSLVKPAVDAVSGWFADNWDTIVGIVTDGGNLIVRVMVGAVDIIRTVVAAIPDSFTVAGVAAAQGFVNAIIWMARETLATINGILAKVNALSAQVGLGNPGLTVGFPDQVVPDLNVDELLGGVGAQAAERLKAGWGDLFNRLGETAGHDFMGSFFAEVGKRARENARSRQTDDDDDDKRAGKARRLRQEMSALERQAQQLAETVAGTLRDAWQGFWRDLFDNSDKSKSMFERLGDAAGKALTKIGDKLMEIGTGMGFDALFGSVGRGAGKGTGILGNLASTFMGMLGGGGGTGSALAAGASSLFGGGGKSIWASLFHSGGTVGQPADGRFVPVNLFDGAPRYHNGLRPDEFPAILQQGETVLPRGVSAGVPITIQDNRTLSVGSGSSSDIAALRAELDRDREQLLQELPRLVAYHVSHPRRG